MRRPPPPGTLGRFWLLLAVRPSGRALKRRQVCCAAVSAFMSVRRLPWWASVRAAPAA